MASSEYSGRQYYIDIKVSYDNSRNINHSETKVLSDDKYLIIRIDRYQNMSFEEQILTALNLEKYQII